MKILTVGDNASLSKAFNQEDVFRFSKLSLDTNPIHLDVEYASNTLFGKRIVHGFLYSSLISAVIANQLPGAGTIYMGQSLIFMKPVYLGETVEARVEVTEIFAEKKQVILITQCFTHGNLVVDGQARVLVPRERIVVGG